MKKVFFPLLLIISFNCYSQIGDVKAEKPYGAYGGTYGRIYDQYGKYTGKQFVMPGNLVGFNDYYVVVQNGTLISVFNDQGKSISTFNLRTSGCYIKKITNSYISIKEGNYLVFYDFYHKFIKQESSY